MLPADVLQRYAKESPLALMAHMGLCQAVPPEWLKEGTHKLLLSTTFEAMGLFCLSPFAASSLGERLSASVTSLYNEIDDVHTTVVRALLGGSAERFVPAMEEINPKGERSVAGLRLRLVDGIHAPASRKHLKPPSNDRGTALRKQALVVYDPDLELVLDVLPWEDADAPQRLIPLASKGELWIADHDFCSAPIILGLIEREAFFLVREHAAHPDIKVETGLRAIRSMGRIESGRLYEQTVSIKDKDEVAHRLSRIEIHLYQETQGAHTVIRLLTNVPPAKLSPRKIAELSLRRWRIVAIFQRLDDVLQREIKTLRKPHAALFAFGVAALAYNVLSLLIAAVRVQHASTLEQLKIDVSPYHIATQIQGDYSELMLFSDPADWRAFASPTGPAFTQTLLGMAANVKPRRFRSNPQKPKAS